MMPLPTVLLNLPPPQFVLILQQADRVPGVLFVPDEPSTSLLRLNSPFRTDALEIEMPIWSIPHQRAEPKNLNSNVCHACLCPCPLVPLAFWITPSP